LNIVWDFPVPEPEPEGADRLERDYSHLELSTVSEMPYNAETPLPALLDEVTDSDLVYVRNHFDVPKIDASDWMLELGGAVESPQAFSLSDITALPAKTLRMTLECAGNGRASMDPVPAGTRWGYGAVSAVEFSGTPLSNLLDQAGISKKAAEVVFHGADKGEPMPGRTEQYVRSLPLDVALKPDTILAWEMNGAPLSTNHGYPLRLVVPSWYGMASVKWLNQIIVSKEIFSGFFQDEQYVYVEEEGTPEGEPVRSIRVRSLILDSTQKEDGQVEIRGIAWSGDGTISKVEVSWDGGAEWRDAELDGSRSPHDFQGWRFLWNSGDEAEFEFVSRATDSSGQVQPINNRWNRGGYGNNGLHRIAIRSG
jgi:DMSO/TMAO reductase YedYZ molybdopterin-dependent catalytic subunit